MLPAPSEQTPGPEVASGSRAHLKALREPGNCKSAERTSRGGLTFELFVHRERLARPRAEAIEAAQQDVGRRPALAALAMDHALDHEIHTILRQKHRRVDGDQLRAQHRAIGRGPHRSVTASPAPWLCTLPAPAQTVGETPASL